MGYLILGILLAPVAIFLAWAIFANVLWVIQRAVFFRSIRPFGPQPKSKRKP